MAQTHKRLKEMKRHNGGHHKTPAADLPRPLPTRQRFRPRRQQRTRRLRLRSRSRLSDLARAARAAAAQCGRPAAGTAPRCGRADAEARAPGQEGAAANKADKASKVRQKGIISFASTALHSMTRSHTLLTTGC